MSFPILASCLFFLLFLFPSCSCSIDTLTLERPMREGQTLISSGEIFTLGFFSPSGSNIRYLGVWYSNDPEGSIVWVANRDRPIPAIHSSNATRTQLVLRITGAGDLAIVEGEDRTSPPIWSTNVSSVVSRIGNQSAATATLTSLGNLVLRDGCGVVLWESFDYPTHAHLPGMKLGWDRKTGLNRRLTSWRAASDPAPGEYIHELELGGAPQFFTKKGADRIFRRGPWNGQRFSSMMNNTKIINLHFVDTVDEVYLTWAPYNASLLTRYQLDESGKVLRYAWASANRRWNLVNSLPSDRCDEYRRCGPNGVCDPTAMPELECGCLRGFEPNSAADWHNGDRSGGCARRRRLLCGRRDGFLRLERMKLPDASAARVERRWSLKTCEDGCLKNCTCTAFANANISDGGSGCLMWFGDLIDLKLFQPGGGQDLYTRVEASELDKIPETPSRSFSSVKKVVIVLPILLLAFAAFGCFWWRRKKANIGLMVRECPQNVAHQNDFKEGGEDSALPFFHSNIIADSTDNFSEANLLGTGGFGSVYKGKLPNGQEIAVKRLSKNSRQGTEEFKNEVSLIAKLQHRNLVRLLGCCIDGEEKMLVYEFMQNKSLDCFIFDPPEGALLDWRKRFSIIMGIARGILYLHEDSRLRIIHRDLKASNVLLDGEMNPRISDFGLARIFDGDQIQGKTCRVVGTYGYMSPEYCTRGFFSAKSDVFSFGIILLDIISGKRIYDCYSECSSMTLTGYAWKLWREGKAMALVDSSILSSCCEVEVSRCIHLGLLCVEECVHDRPDMSLVILMLGNETMKMPMPKQPAFCFHNDSSFGWLQHSNDEAIITEVEGR